MTQILSPGQLAGLQIETVAQRSQFLNCMIYGDSGIGKTTLAGSASVVRGMAPVLLIDVEGGTESLRNPYPNVEVVRVKSIDQFQDVYNALYKGDHKYKTTIIDSGTEVQRFGMTEIMRELIERRPDLDPDVPGMREYGKSLNQMRKIVRGFRDLEMHTIFTALNGSFKDERTGLTMMQPSFTGQFAREVPALLDIVMYYYVKTVEENGERTLKRLLLTKKTDSQVAKDRTNKLPMIIEDPTMQIIYDLVVAGQEPIQNPTGIMPELEAINI